MENKWENPWTTITGRVIFARKGEEELVISRSYDAINMKYYFSIYDPKSEKETSGLTSEQVESYLKEWYAACGED